MKQLFSKLRGWCGDMHIDKVMTLQQIIEKRWLLIAMKKVDKSFTETNKPIYNEIIKPILTSPKIEHACNLQ